MPKGCSSRYGMTLLSKHRVYFTASILTVQWLAHTVHEIVTCFNPICHQVLYDRRVKLLITKSKRNKITPSHNHATLLLHHNSFSRVKRETSLAARSEEKPLFSQARKTSARRVKKELIIRGSPPPRPGPPTFGHPRTSIKICINF